MLALGEILGKDTKVVADLLNEPVSSLYGGNALLDNYNKKETDILKSEITRLQLENDQLKRLYEVKQEYILQELSLRLYQQDQTINTLLATSSPDEASGIFKSVKLEQDFPELRDHESFIREILERF